MILLSNPFRSMHKKDWIIWIVSLTTVLISNVISGDTNPLTIVSACIGITGLIWAAIGNFWAHLLFSLFAVLYAIISYRYRYWGEMFTSLVLALPMSLFSLLTWLKNITPGSEGIVSIRHTTKKTVSIMAILNIFISVCFYFILGWLKTPNLVLSTFSISTSFLASFLSIMRSSYYSLGYLANDLVLIILWLLASLDESRYIPVFINFLIFFLNDMYIFHSWRKREKANTEKIKMY